MPQGVGASSCSRGGAARATTTAAKAATKQMRRRRVVFVAAEGAGPSGTKSAVVSLSFTLHVQTRRASLFIEQQRALPAEQWSWFSGGEKRRQFDASLFRLLNASSSFSLIHPPPPPPPPPPSPNTPLGQSSDTSQQQQPLPVPPLRPPQLKKASGLARTPSGGLAAGGALTSTDLPPPAVAVRNLIELAQYAHLASNMSQMHHR